MRTVSCKVNLKDKILLLIKRIFSGCIFSLLTLQHMVINISDGTPTGEPIGRNHHICRTRATDAGGRGRAPAARNHRRAIRLISSTMTRSIGVWSTCAIPSARRCFGNSTWDAFSWRAMRSGLPAVFPKVQSDSVASDGLSSRGRGEPYYVLHGPFHR